MSAARPSSLIVTDPIRSNVLGSVPNLSREAVLAAADRARLAQRAWAASPVRARAGVLQRFADALVQRQDLLIDVIRQESGKSYSGALNEVGILVVTADYYARHAPRWLRPAKRRGFAPLAYGVRVHRKPYGLVGAITPWNFPLMLALVDALPALVAGNAVLLKPSEVAPFSALEGRRLLVECGLPEDALQVLTGDAVTGEALVDAVDYVMFTGSEAVGRRVAVRAAERLIPCSLELGGSDAMIVLREADLDKAAAAAIRGGFENAGQVCIGTERIFVEAEAYPRFIRKLKKWHGRLRVGPERSLDVHMGSMTHLPTLQRTEAQIADALHKGGKLLVGGQRLPELGQLFFAPTIITDATPEMHALQSETFGPLITVMSVPDAETAVRLANSIPLGLSASVWSRNLNRAQAVAQQLETGDVNINSVLMTFGMPAMEQGGVKQSGLGRRNGQQGLLKYTYTQSVLVEHIHPPTAVTVSTRFFKRFFLGYRWLSRRLPFLGS
ncbi:MAG: aldehyde dehydrogenase family protein [Anaerolineae bacterium]|nr:aldehyde dehydrogenase family protein [Anaerolineae bacterium]